MDFDIAARRLQKDQQSALARSRASRNARTATAKAKREAALARQKAEKRLREKKLESERNARITDTIVRGVRRVERDLGVTDVGSWSSSSSSPLKTDVVLPAVAAAVAANPDKSSLLFTNSPLSSGWTFAATSIHGDGDKIALPPSVLETMTSNANDLDPWGSGRNGRPIAFRIGILNPDYAFPSSEKMRALVEIARQEVISSEKIELAQQTSSASEFSNDGSTNEDMDDDETNDSQITEAYLDELSHRYLSYTHGTVVEFTQENECVGLPEPIARALLQPNSHSLVGNALSGRKNHITMKRTVDPAPSAVKSDVANDESNFKSDANDAMDVDTPNNKNDTEDVDTSRTPGHPAYGLFDVPALPIEITPVNSLLPGKNCTFTPTASSIKNGFYSLKDVKSVLEQSLMRTRATLSRGDVIRTWRRGVSFDLIVSILTPTEYGAVSCINTNLNVDIGPPEGEEDATSNDVGNNIPKPATKTTNPMGGGRLLSEPSPPTKLPGSMPSPIDAAVESIVLPPEPAANVKEGVCNIQIRGRTPSGNSAAGRRRFDTTTAIMSDLFAFASQVCDGVNPTAFRLVTRFPRQVFRVASSGGVGDDCFAADATLESAGIGQGQEMFMVETV